MPAQLFSDFADQWMRGQRIRLQPSTAEGYGVVIRLYLSPAFQHRTVDDIRSDDLNQLYAHLLDSGGTRFNRLAPSSVKQVHAVASRIFDGAIRQGLISVNPAWGASPPQPYGGEPRPTFSVWNAEQVAHFLDATADHPLATIFRLAAMTGMRRSELLGLQWHNIRSGRLLVQAALTETRDVFSLHTPKIRRPRLLTLDADTDLHMQRHHLREVMKEHAVNSPATRWNLVFTDGHGDAVHPGEVTHQFRRWVARSDLPRIRFHDLRHTHATLLLTSGVPMHVVAARLGHSPRVLLSHYAHLLPSADELAAAVFGELINGQRPNYRQTPASPWVEPHTAFGPEMWQWNKRSTSRRLAVGVAP